MRGRIIIKDKLRRRIEAFLAAGPVGEEFGGFLLKSRRSGLVSEFLPILNASEFYAKQYDVGNRERAKRLAQKLAESLRMETIAFWHNHPYPCIMSAGDLSSAGAYYPDLIFVTISPLEGPWTRRFIWYACKGVEPVELEFRG